MANMFTCHYIVALHLFLPLQRNVIMDVVAIVVVLGRRSIVVHVINFVVLVPWRTPAVVRDSFIVYSPS
jgi:hypothetical protein